MSTAATTKVTKAAAIPVTPDTYTWNNPYGGFWSTAANWTDTTQGSAATVAPGVSNTVSIAGGAYGADTVIAGTGAAGQMNTSGDVLLLGTVVVQSALSLSAGAELDLDGGASLVAASVTLGGEASLVLGGGSTLIATSGAQINAGFVAAFDGSSMQLGGLVANTVDFGYAQVLGTVAVDDNSAIEVGTAGNAALGAITIDKTNSAAVSGAIDGNVVVNGTLGVQAYAALGIDLSDPFGSAQSIGGSGTILLSEDSLLSLGVADTAAIRFGGPAGTLDLSALNCGTITGFGAGDIIGLIGSGAALATGLTYTQVNATLATLTLTRGGKAVGTLDLAGNYSGSLFHLAVNSSGVDSITVQTIGSAAAQPSLILGTAGSDTLNATANGQILTGLGGNDLLNAGAFTGIDFKDTTADLGNSTIVAFGTSDVIDLTDLKPATASVAFTAGTNGLGTLVVTDGTHTGTISLGMSNPSAVGVFSTTADGTGGTDVKFTAINTDADSFSASQGSFANVANWLDTTTGTAAAVVPSYGNAVTLNGGSGYLDVSGSGLAASLQTSGDVLQWGSLNIGSTLPSVSGALVQTGTLALDGGAHLVLAGSAVVGGLVEVGNASTLTAAGGLSFTGYNASLLAINGGAIRLASVLNTGSSYSVIGVDNKSSIEFGNAGGAAAGALTIDSGVTAALCGLIDGNVVVNGTLDVSSALTIAPFGTTAPAISGSGTLVLTWNDSLTLAGADSAAILFSQTGTSSFYGKTETLALTGALPTGTISGFTTGDDITIAKAVTSLSYSQSGSSGVLKLMNGTSTVGTLQLAGTYAAGQFELAPLGIGASSIITYAANPGTVTGNSVASNADVYSWAATAGGAWSNASNWSDTTTGATPSTAPGAGNTIIMSDNTGALTAQIVSGNGSAAALTVTGGASTIFTGTIAVAGTVTVNTYAAGAEGVLLANGASLTAGGLNVSASLGLSGASALSIVGASATTAISGTLSVIGGSSVKVTAGSSDLSGTLIVDAASSVEFGSTGGAAAGSVTIDSGQDPILQGVATIAAGKLVMNGNMLAYAATIEGYAGATSAISGAGTITIGALGGLGSLTLNASDTAAIAFKPYTNNNVPYAFETLVLDGPLPTGVISGMIAGDTIQVGAAVTGVKMTQTGTTQATLTLLDGATTVGTLALGGNDTGDLFQVDVAPATGFGTISIETAAGAAGTATASTGKDAYSWIGASGASWSTAADWKDTTANATATTMPGSLDPVTIAGNKTAGQYTVVGGNGSAATLTMSGNVLLTGQVTSAGVVKVGGSGPAATLSLDAGASLTSAGSLALAGRLELEGASSASVTGYAVMTGGTILALGGSTVQIGNLCGNGASNVIAIDGNSILKVGKPSTASAGALTQALGLTSVFDGSIFGSVVANGTLAATGGGALWIDMAGTVESDPYGTPTITGAGTLALTDGSTLGLGVTDTVGIQFAGPNANLVLAALPSATISGFAAGDTIQIDRPVTGLLYTQTSVTSGTLTLTNGTATVGQLSFSGTYGNGLTAFHLDAAANGSTAVITLQSLQVAPLQPTLIQGTVGADLLTATANGQTLTGLGGTDTLNGGSFTAIDFKDLTANLSGCTIQDFAPSDIIDFTDMKSTSASLTYTNGMLSITDGTHAASIAVGFLSQPAAGSFHIASDGSSGTKLTWS